MYGKCEKQGRKYTFAGNVRLAVSRHATGLPFALKTTLSKISHLRAWVAWRAVQGQSGFYPINLEVYESFCRFLAFSLADSQVKNPTINKNCLTLLIVNTRKSEVKSQKRFGNQVKIFFPFRPHHSNCSVNQGSSKLCFHNSPVLHHAPRTHHQRRMEIQRN